MDEIRKPLLYPGYSLPNGISVLRRVGFEYYIEVYSLSNGEYLLLPLKIAPSDVRNSSSELLSLKIAGVDYIGVLAERWSRKTLRDLVDFLVTPRGFNAVAGMESLKNTLYKELIAPLRNPDKYRKFKVNIPNGILLYGPPGCGKTFISRKIAEELNYKFIELKHSDIASTYVHGTVKLIQRAFENARNCAPSIVFLDEIDGILPRRDSVSSSQGHKNEEINEFLLQLNDAGKQGILVIAATNRPGAVDPALLRSGRMDLKIYVPPPDGIARLALLKYYLNDRPIEGIDFVKLAEKTEGYSSADIEFICNEAARNALINDRDAITQDDVMRVLEKVSPSIIP